MCSLKLAFPIGLILIVCAFFGVIAVASKGAETASKSSSPIQSVTGSGLVEEGGVVFRTTVAAHRTATGDVWGVVTVNLDLSAFGISPLITFRQSVTCLEVDGDSAWIGGVVTNSNNEEIIPEGTTVITLIRDLGGAGEDIMHGEPFDPVMLCSDRPLLPETTVKQGNYTIR